MLLPTADGLKRLRRGRAKGWVGVVRTALAWVAWQRCNGRSGVNDQREALRRRADGDLRDPGLPGNDLGCFLKFLRFDFQ